MIPAEPKDYINPPLKKVMPNPIKDKVSNRPNPRRNEEKMKEAITKAYADLKSLWFEKGIPECHMEVMTKLFNR